MSYRLRGVESIYCSLHRLLMHGSITATLLKVVAEVMLASSVTPRCPTAQSTVAAHCQQKQMQKDRCNSDHSWHLRLLPTGTRLLVVCPCSPPPCLIWAPLRS